MQMHHIAAVLATLASLPATLGHTWIEQLRSINDQGEYVGEYGYPRGMYGKTDPGYTGDSMNWVLPQLTEKTQPFIGPNSSLCHTAQRTHNQTDKYPRLKASPGKFIAMRYMENGHISKPNVRIGKPEKGGTVYVFGTTQPKDDEKIADVLQWTQDGSGGDKRGKIIAMNDYDDGRCYEVSQMPISVARQKATPNYAFGQATAGGPGGFPLFCETNAAIPTDAATGKPYTLYWVWQWATEPGKDPTFAKGQDEYYTTCIDVDVVGDVSGQAEQQFALGQQDAMTEAVSDFKSRTAVFTDIMAREYGSLFNSSKTAGGAQPTSAGAQPSSVAAQPSSAAAQPSSVAAQPSSIAVQPTSMPFSNSTASASAPANIPTLTQAPDGASPSQTTFAAAGGDEVTVTVTTLVTKTAAAVTQTLGARAEHIARHANARFRRGRYFRE